MPHVRRLKSGNWNAVVRLPGGKRKSITDPLKRVVERRARDLQSAVDRGEPVHLRERRLTVEAWHTRWLRARDVEPPTARKDESRWRNHVQPQWGAWTLQQLGRPEARLDVQEWVTGMHRRGVGISAIEGAYQLFTTLMSDAVDHGLIPMSPCRKIKLPRGEKPDDRWLTRHEYDLLQLTLSEMTDVLGGRSHVPYWKALVGLGCFCGLRPGELAGLDVRHVDLEARLVRVEQVMARMDDPRCGYRWGLRRYPKSDRSTRWVPFPAEVADLLWPVVADRAAGPLFPGPRGGRLVFEGNFQQRVWTPALNAAGIEPVRPYVMRHTCASWLVQKGVSDRRIMQILGHADTHLIALYAHLAPKEHDEIRAAWGEDSEAAGARLTHDDSLPVRPVGE